MQFIKNNKRAILFPLFFQYSLAIFISVPIKILPVDLIFFEKSLCQGGFSNLTRPSDEDHFFLQVIYDEFFAVTFHIVTIL